ncbi:MAG: NAD(P)/FAD-dependent oxidoreductase [Planctomycetes bacterium]|nr:NAD(P)/FAD-dependent oxidoreductase [Planctomycetota bacterium]
MPGDASLPPPPTFPDGRAHVVIVGGGFGGLYAARALGRAPVRVTVIDRKNHHVFQPLLYQVATAALNPSDIASPIRRILRRQQNTTVLLAEATGVDVPGKRLLLADGGVPYDYLLLATGVTHSYFGHDDWARHAPGLKNLEDALEIRRRVLVAYEAAEREPDRDRRREWLTFVVVGAGPTGVELAGALAEISRHALARDFRNIDPTQARILLLEGTARVLPSYPPALSEKAAGQLARLGVEVRTAAQVTGIDNRTVALGKERLFARTVLWAAGVTASPLARTLGVPLDRAGRVHVRPDLTIPGRDDVFVVGDLASFEQDGRPLPGMAPPAIQEAQHAARNILRALDSKPYLPFQYVHRGSMATIGRAAAVADLGFLTLSGLTAWLVWLLIHILWLIGFRNRLVVLIGWAWAYIKWERGARLITGIAAPLVSSFSPSPQSPPTDAADTSPGASAAVPAPPPTVLPAVQAEAPPPASGARHPESAPSVPPPRSTAGFPEEPPSRRTVDPPSPMGGDPTAAPV